MNERDIILVIIFSIVGVLSCVFIVIFFILFCIRRQMNKKQVPQRQKYERSRNATTTTTTNLVLNKQKQRRKKRFNTNESVVSWTFNSPHLINQNVRNLDQFIVNESPRNEEMPLQTSSTSSFATPMSSLVLGLQSYPFNQQSRSLHFEFLNQLNHIVCLKQNSSTSNQLQYSQSCRQQTDLEPFDYARKARLAQLRDDTAIFY